MNRTPPDLFSFASSAPGAPALSVVAFQGVERISRPFRFDVDVAPADPGAPIDALVGQPARLSVRQAGRETIRCGVITQVEEGLAQLGDREVHRVTLEPRWSLLDLSIGSRALRNLTVPEAVLAVLASEGDALGAGDVEVRLSREHPRRERLVQDGESAMAFLSRLIQREGMVYCFEHRGDREILILADDPAQLPAASGGPVPFAATGDRAEPHVSSLRRTSRLPQRRGSPATSGDRSRAVHGDSSCATLQAGHRFSVVGHPRADLLGELLMVEVRHRGHLDRGYDNEIDAIQTADLAPAPRESSSGDARDAGQPSPPAAAEPPPGGASVWRVGPPPAPAAAPVSMNSRAGAPQPLEQQRHFTVDDDQNQRLDAVEQKNAQQDQKDAQHDQKIADVEQKNAAQDQKDAEHDKKLAAASADTQNTWLRFNVPYATDKTAYLRLGKSPTEGTDIETPLREKLTLNKEGSLDGQFEYTTGNRTIITGGNKEEIVDGKHRIAINSGGLGLFDADPIYFLDFSQDVTGAWRKSEFTHVSSSQFAIGDTSSWMMGVTGGYFLGIKVEASAALSLSLGLGINYAHVKGISFQEAKTHDIKARDSITIRVKSKDPFFNHKNKAIVTAGLLAGGAAAIALAAAGDRSGMGRATAAAGTAPTVGLATAVSIAAVLDVYKRLMQRAAGIRRENDSVITLTENHIDAKSGTNNTSVLIDGTNDQIMMSVNNGSSFVYVAGPGGGQEVVNVVSTGMIRLHAPTIEVQGNVDLRGNLHVFQNIQYDGNLNGPPLAVAPVVVPAAVLPPVPPPPSLFQRVVGRLMFWRA